MKEQPGSQEKPICNENKKNKGEERVTICVWICEGKKKKSEMLKMSVATLGSENSLNAERHGINNCLNFCIAQLTPN